MENWELTWTKLTTLVKTKIDKINDELPGVYRLSYEADDGSYYVFYIGKAKDIKTRLNSHLSQSEGNVCIKNYLATKKCFFRYAEISEDYVRDAAEKQMYKHYAPQCNEIEPEGKENVKVNLN